MILVVKGGKELAFFYVLVYFGELTFFGFYSW